VRSGLRARRRSGAPRRRRGATCARGPVRRGSTRRSRAARARRSQRRPLRRLRPRSARRRRPSAHAASIAHDGAARRWPREGLACLVTHARSSRHRHDRHDRCVVLGIGLVGRLRIAVQPPPPRRADTRVSKALLRTRGGAVASVRAAPPASRAASRRAWRASRGRAEARAVVGGGALRHARGAPTPAVPAPALRCAVPSGFAPPSAAARCPVPSHTPSCGACGGKGAAGTPQTLFLSRSPNASRGTQSFAAMALQANKLTHRFHTSLLGVLRARHLHVARTVRGVMCALSYRALMSLLVADASPTQTSAQEGAPPALQAVLEDVKSQVRAGALLLSR